MTTWSCVLDLLKHANHPVVRLHKAVQKHIRVFRSGFFFLLTKRTNVYKRKTLLPTILKKKQRIIRLRDATQVKRAHLISAVHGAAEGNSFFYVKSKKQEKI